MMVNAKHLLLWGLGVLLFVDIAIEGVGLFVGYVMNAPPAAVSNAPIDAELDLTARPVRGNPAAPLAVVEFSDYECPFCIQYSTTSRKEVVDRYVDTGRLLYSFANFPLPIHPRARPLAEVAICAHDQSLFWEVHEGFFEEQPRSDGEIEEFVLSVGVNYDELTECLESAKAIEIIDADVSDLTRIGVVGTPSFGVGIVGEGGVVRILRVIRGNQPIEVFDDVIGEVSAVMDKGSSGL